ncbi:MAG: exodeoxyribonuclease III [Erythrobacter sp.]|nr:MAG: exodeoxyribonuclease III [Erythrobacter sp.]
MLSIATWNINSVRLRLGLVEHFLRSHAPDILCLQEIKCESHLFPAEALAALGYVHQVVSGQKGYHGVATLARVPIREAARHDWQANGEARHIGVEVVGRDVWLENVYVPAGGDVPDRALNPKFGQKLDFLGRMTRWAERLDRPTLLVGDFNIAPLECDVWSHKQLLKVVSHTPIEVETLARLQDAHGWVDLGRTHIPAPQRYYSWWSYRNPGWRENDKGRRLDHMWASPALAGQARAHRVIEEARAWEQPSDHVPLITELDL